MSNEELRPSRAERLQDLARGFRNGSDAPLAERLNDSRLSSIKAAKIRGRTVGECWIERL